MSAPSLDSIYGPHGSNITTRGLSYFYKELMIAKLCRRLTRSAMCDKSLTLGENMAPHLDPATRWGSRSGYPMGIGNYAG